MSIYLHGYIPDLRRTQSHYLVLSVVDLVSGRRVLAVRNLIAVSVVGRGRVILATPFLDDRGQNSPARARGLDVDVGSRVGSGLEVLVQRAGVAAVHEDLGVVSRGFGPVADVVAGLLSDKVVDVGADVEATESVQVPVCFDGAELRVVVVPVLVGGPDELLRDGVAEDQAEDAVALGVGFAFVEGDEYEGAVPEAGLFVIDQRFQEVAAPFSGDGNGGVVAVACLCGCQLCAFLRYLDPRTMLGVMNIH